MLSTAVTTLSGRCTSPTARPTMAETRSRRAELRGAPLEHDVAVAQDDHAVGDLPHLVEAVRDVDERDALLAQAPHEGEEALDLLGRERRGRLVEDQAARLVGQGACDLHDLPLADAQRRHRRVEVRAARRAAPARGAHAAGPGASETMPARFGSRPSEMFSATDSEPASFSSWKIMRMPSWRAVIGVSSVCSEPPTLIVPRVGLVVARDDLDQRGLARAVLAEERHHLAAGGVEVHAVQDLDAAERLADRARLESKGVRHHVRGQGLALRGRLRIVLRHVVLRDGDVRHQQLLRDGLALRRPG